MLGPFLQRSLTNPTTSEPKEAKVIHNFATHGIGTDLFPFLVTFPACLPLSSRKTLMEARKDSRVLDSQVYVILSGVRVYPSLPSPVESAWN